MSMLLKRAGPALAGVLLLAAPLPAQRVDASRLVELHVNAQAHNRSITGTVAEGQGFQISFDDVGSFQLVPVVVDEDAGTVRVTVYKGTVGGEISEMRIVETVTAQRGVPVAIRSMPSVGLVVDGIRRVAPAGQALQISVSPGFGVPIAGSFGASRDTCCVSCGGITACACAVSGDCGWCCSGGCCPEKVSGERSVPAPRSFMRLVGACRQPIRDEERMHTAPAPARVAIARG